MIDYKIIKFCRTCKTRFVVNKGESKKNYCDDCQKKFLKSFASKKSNEWE